MNKCSTKDKYIVISLKEDIILSGFSLINKEFYSSNVQEIKVINKYFILFYNKKDFCIK